MPFNPRLLLPRRMAGAATLCAAAAYTISLQHSARQDAHRGMAGDAGRALVVPPSRTATRKQSRALDRMQSWRLPRSSVHQKYVLEGVIGEGGFGLVHVGRHRGSKARVAIKRMPKQLTPRAKFLQEVGILDQVGGTHNVVALHEAFETTEDYVLVTELVQGGELYDELVQHGVFDEERAKALVRKLAMTLEYLHSRQVVHADVKPENILLSGNDDTDLKLIDFGQSFRLTHDGGHKMDVCTIAYASPEVMQRQHAGCAMDVWALGVVLFIVLCGTHPFDPTNDAPDNELQERILTGEFDGQAAGWARLSDGARDLIRQMLTVDPDKRISAANVLQHEWITSGSAVYQVQ